MDSTQMNGYKCMSVKLCVRQQAFVVAVVVLFFTDCWPRLLEKKIQASHGRFSK